MKYNFIVFTFTSNVSLKQPVVKIYFPCLENIFRPYVFKIKPLFGRAELPSNLYSELFLFCLFFYELSASEIIVHLILTI